MTSDGGPAFARTGGMVPGPSMAEWVPPQAGITARDWFAAHCDQPGQLEIANAAGVTVQESSPLPWHSDEYKALPTFRQWYYALGQEERFRLSAKARYQMADAMIAQRSKP